MKTKRLIELLDKGVIYEKRPNFFVSLDEKEEVVKTEGDVKKIIQRQKKLAKEIKALEWSY